MFLQSRFVHQPYGIRGRLPCQGYTNKRPKKARAGTGKGEGDDQGEAPRMDEETISRLRKAEEETERLKQELAALRADREAEQGNEKEQKQFWSGVPFDSKDLKRETILESNIPSGNWLSEADVDFLTGGERQVGLTEEEQAIVNRRLTVGGTFAVIFAALAFIPSENLRLFKPSGSPVDYLIPILRSQALLKECAPLVEDAQWEQIRAAIDRIINSPNNLKSNLESALAFVDASDDRTKGRRLISDIMEFVQEMDYNKYFEDRLNTRRFRGGAEEARFVEFSRNALTTAQMRLNRFLLLFSRDDVAAATSKIAIIYTEPSQSSPEAL